MADFIGVMSSIGACLNNVNASTNDSMAEPIEKVAKKLDELKIEYIKKNIFDGMQLVFPWCEADVVCHSGSYGGKAKLMEVYGNALLTDEELEEDAVKGYLTVDDVVERVTKAWKNVE